MGTHLLLICLCLGVLSTVTGCAVPFPSYDTSSYKAGTEEGTLPYSKQYHPWDRPAGYYSE